MAKELANGCNALNEMMVQHAADSLTKGDQETEAPH